MGKQTQIAWTGATWNPWTGCHQVSPGCAHCYAKTLTERWGKDFGIVKRTSDATFYSPLKWKEPSLVFSCSMSDWFHEDADEWRDEAWDIIRRTPQHTYQILTKRPERILEHLPADWGDGYPNVWLGTSVENQHFADVRIPILRQVPAVVRFLSCEPLLGPLDLHFLLAWDFAEDDLRFWQPVHWVIVGGESGPGFRPMDPAWVRGIMRDCRTWKVAFFFKQSAGPRPETDPYIDGVQYREFPKVAA